MAEWQMNPDEVIELIKYYAEFQCLWNCRSEDYKRSDLKQDAWEELATHYSKNVSVIKRKIKYLRSAYLHEKKRVDNSIRAGRNGYRPRLFYFSDFNFLNSVIILRKAISTATKDTFESTFITKVEECDDEENNSLNCTEELDTVVPKKSPVQYNDRKHKTAKQSKQLEPKSTSHIEETTNPFDSAKSSGVGSIYSAFGKTISLQLSQLSPLEATAAMAEIHQILSKKIMRSMLAASDRSMDVSSFSTSDDENNLTNGRSSKYKPNKSKRFKC